MSFRLYAVHSPDRELLQIADELIFTKEISFLASFADWSIEDAKWAKKWIRSQGFADSGSFSAYGRKKGLFLKESSMKDLARFYEAGPFEIVVEPDVLEVRQPLGKVTAALRAQKLGGLLNSEIKRKLIRPIQGKDPTERMEYINFINNCTQSVDRVAIGGIARKKLSQSYVFETAEKLIIKYKKIHLFGRTSLEAIDLAVSLFKLGFQDVTVDSLSWAQSVFDQREIWLFQDNGAMLKFNFGEKNSIPQNTHLLNECSCPICIFPVFKEDHGIPQKLGTLGLLSRKRDKYYTGLFVKRGKLHNLYQQRKYVEFKLGLKKD